MSTVSESNPWCAMISAENELGIDSQPFTTASPRAQIALSVFSLTSLSLWRKGLRPPLDSPPTTRDAGLRPPLDPPANTRDAGLRPPLDSPANTRDAGLRPLSTPPRTRGTLGPAPSRLPPIT